MAAAANNSHCVVGIAYEARIGGEHRVFVRIEVWWRTRPFEVNWDVPVRCAHAGRGCDRYGGGRVFEPEP